MQRVKLGKSDLLISRLTLGAWAYGRDQWGNVDDNDSIKTIHHAIDCGCNIIDTAPGYADGYSEEIVGRGIKGRRDKVYIATKCAADPKYIMKQIDESLKRLQIDCIDLYQVHYPSSDIIASETMGCLTKLQKAGKIRWIGVSNYSAKQLEEAMSFTDIVSCQSAYNIVWREIEIEGILDFCVKNEIGILSYSTIAQGLLSGKYKSYDELPKEPGGVRTRNRLFQEGIVEDVFETVKLLSIIAEKYGKTITQTAINWALQTNGVESAIVGAKTPEQFDENVGALEWKLDNEDIELIGTSGMKVASLMDYSYNMWNNKYPR